MQYSRVAAIPSVGALLVLGALSALAQPATPPVQVTAGALVPAASATHIAILAGANEVPPVQTAGTGTAWIIFDPATNALTWTVEFADLSGPAAAAHFHGPAEAGANAGVAVGIIAAGTQPTSPIQGTATITAEQAAQLQQGLWYVNIHTAANGGGEIRGQVVPTETAAAGPDPALMAALIDEGRSVYRQQCVACHGNQGQGSAGQRLVEYQYLANTAIVVGQILRGGAYMPPFPQLTDRQIAAVATFIRNSFDNEFGIVTEQEVQALR